MIAILTLREGFFCCDLSHFKRFFFKKEMKHCKQRNLKGKKGKSSTVLLFKFLFSWSFYFFFQFSSSFIFILYLHCFHLGLRLFNSHLFIGTLWPCSKISTTLLIVGGKLDLNSYLRTTSSCNTESNGHFRIQLRPLFLFV